MKSSIALYQALKSIDISDERATAVVDAVEADMATHLVTKADLKTELKDLELRLTIRMGLMLSAVVGIMLAGMRYML
ncbi:hypothetical protein [Pseudomonas sp. MYb185]|jgi:hypothetical protein|uniref:hypothetical protein n=1 Tax=Pseudomonas sp. MYb185 TaxID=1848729 RepID=UPI000CFBE700|nr:hypothetical protein [Pseudomonas sp. MYb185]PRB81539.1 hypothetical protein CQ007_10360 [Pseudomonas sp. MYb185]